MKPEIDQIIDSTKIIERKSPEFYGLDEKNVPYSYQPIFYMEFPNEWVDPKERGKQITEMLLSPVSEDIQVPLAEYLAWNNCGIALAMTELDDSTAEAIQILNKFGIPVEAWITIDDNEGYFLNPLSIKPTINKIGKVLEWSKEKDLQIDSIGLDLEPPFDFHYDLWRDIKPENYPNRVSYIKDWMKHKIDISWYWLNYINECKKYKNDVKLLSEYLNNLQDDQIKTTLYSSIIWFSPMDIPNFNPDKKVQLRYTNIITNPIFKKFLNPDFVAALGIVNGIDGETPGRDFSKGVMPDHLTDIDLINYIASTLSLYRTTKDGADALNSIFQFYIFALNDPSVVKRVYDILKYFPKKTRKVSL
jgi:hypothetical protein